MCFNCHLYRAKIAEIFFLTSFCLVEIKLEFPYFPVELKKKRGRILMKTFMLSSGECSDFSILSCSKGFVRGTHPHLSSLPRKYHCNYSKILELALTQKHKVIFFLKLGITKIKVSLVMRNEKKLPVTKTNIFSANVYIHY